MNGFEPLTASLSEKCSAPELHQYIVLPPGLEPGTRWLKASCSTLELRQNFLSYSFLSVSIVGPPGYDPGAYSLWGNCSAEWAKDRYNLNSRTNSNRDVLGRSQRFFQLNYRSLSFKNTYCLRLIFTIRISDSNRGMSVYKTDAVAAEPIRNNFCAPSFSDFGPIFPEAHRGVRQHSCL